MKAFYWMDTINRFRESVRYRLMSSVIVMAGVLFMLGAVGFCVASGFLWLSMQVSSDEAALIVSGVLFIIGGIIMTFALGRNTHRKPTSTSHRCTPETDGEIITDRMVQSALTEVAESPYKAAFAAVAIGVIVGLLRSQKSP